MLKKKMKKRQPIRLQGREIRKILRNFCATIKPIIGQGWLFLWVGNQAFQFCERVRYLSERRGGLGKSSMFHIQS